MCIWEERALGIYLKTKWAPLKKFEKSYSRGKSVPGVGCGDSLAIVLARPALERETCKRYQSKVIRYRLKNMSNKASNRGAELRNEEFCRGSD